jgi:hypothetical protein
LSLNATETILLEDVPMILVRNMLIAAAILTAFYSFAQAKIIYFAGYDWTVKSGKSIGPGPNSWSEDNVWIDQDGYLHLLLSKRDAQWYCAQVSMLHRLGFGRYQFWVTGRFDQLDPNVVFGLFNYPPSDVGPDGTHEIDIEFARWGKPAAPIGNYTVWPAKEGLNNAHYVFPGNQIEDNTTHRFTWSPTSVSFQSLVGHRDDDTGQFGIWRYQPRDAANFIGDSPMPVEMNLWLFRGQPPQNGQEVELMVVSFSFTPE